jgi:hypothetical protein
MRGRPRPRLASPAPQSNVTDGSLSPASREPVAGAGELFRAPLIAAPDDFGVDVMGIGGLSRHLPRISLWVGDVPVFLKGQTTSLRQLGLVHLQIAFMLGCDFLRALCPLLSGHQAARSTALKAVSILDMRKGFDLAFAAAFETFE